MTNIGSASLAVKEMEIMICGYEKILTPKDNSIIVTKEVSEPKLSYDLSSYFETTDKSGDCKIKSIGLFKDD